MNAESLFGALYILVVSFVFVALLGLCEVIFNLLYRYCTAFRSWYDKQEEGLPDWDEDEVME